MPASPLKNLRHPTIRTPRHQQPRHRPASMLLACIPTCCSHWPIEVTRSRHRFRAEIIPYILDGRDVFGQAQTGTGKTAAFALPLLSRIDLSQRTPQVLVLAPTRELALQVHESFEQYAAHLDGFRCTAIYGGSDFYPQIRDLRQGVHVVVGTPGRVIDHMNAARCGSTICGRSCSTKPTKCSGWGSSTTSPGSSHRRRTNGRSHCSPPHCRSRFAKLRASISAIRRRSASNRKCEPPRPFASAVCWSIGETRSTHWPESWKSNRPMVSSSSSRRNQRPRNSPTSSSNVASRQRHSMATSHRVSANAPSTSSKLDVLM